MCVAFPGTVIETKPVEKTATVDFGGTIVTARTGFTKVEVGDHVLVHAGCVLQVLKEDDAKALEEIFDDIAELNDAEKPYEADLMKMGNESHTAAAMQDGAKIPADLAGTAAGGSQ